MDLQKFLEKRGRYAESSDDDEIIDVSLPPHLRKNASVSVASIIVDKIMQQFRIC